MTDPHVILDPSGLGALLSGHSVRPDAGQLRLGGEMADHPRREAWERELNRSYGACGCDSGANGMMLGLAGGVLVTVLTLRNGGGLASLLYVPALVLMGALMGKVGGLVAAKLRLARTIREIRAEWRAS